MIKTIIPYVVYIHYTKSVILLFFFNNFLPSLMQQACHITISSIISPFFVMECIGILDNAHQCGHRLQEHFMLIKGPNSNPLHQP